MYGKGGYGKITKKQWDMIDNLCKKLNIVFRGKNFDDAFNFISQNLPAYEALGGSIIQRRFRRGIVAPEPESPVTVSYLAPEELAKYNSPQDR